ncbi:MAG: hypothetical protein H6R00_186 [Proteobacteria bacterium]|nr:hypothetical protein [Pseudomonadota bacterium]
MAGGILVARWADANLKVFGKRIDALNAQFPKVLPRIVNQVGNRSKTIVIRTLTKQTGLPRKTIVKAVGNPNPARPGKLSFEMRTRGGNIRLKYLRPRETKKGIVAYPFGKRVLFAGAFMRGGAFPKRKTVAKFDGHVMFRPHGQRKNYSFQRSGVYVPVEMTTGRTATEFQKIAAPLLRERVEAALTKLLGP